MLSYRSFRLVAFSVFIIAVGLHVAAFSTAFWFKRYDIYGWLVHHGLWLFCDYYRPGGKDNKCLKLVNRYDDFQNGKLRAVQALMSVSLICLIIATVLFMLWMVCPERRHGRHHSTTVGLVAFLLCIFSGVLTLISVTIFGVYYAKFERVLSWSYILATVSGATLVIGGIVAIVLLMRGSVSELETETRPANQRPFPPLPPLTSHDLNKPGVNATHDVSSGYSMAEYRAHVEKQRPRLQSSPEPTCYRNPMI